MMNRATGWLRSAPDTSTAAKAGAPQMNNPKQNIPANVPLPAEAAGGFNGDVTVAPVNGTSALDTQPDARATQPGAQSSAAGSAAASTANASANPQAQEDNASTKGKKKPKKNQKNQNNQNNQNNQGSPNGQGNPSGQTNP
jgi:hypothetical protein